MNGKTFGKQAVTVLNFSATLAHLAVEFVAKDGEQPRTHVGACREAFLVRPGLHDRILNEVVRLVVATGQGHGKGTQVG
ncbi:hypothetical protein D3C80_702500 [compost metagenome]